MRHTRLSEELEKIEFAKKAARYFSSHDKIYSYTNSEIEPGCYFALRWGAGDDCVLVVKLDEDFIPELYTQIICIPKDEKK